MKKTTYNEPEISEVVLFNKSDLCIVASANGSGKHGIDDYDINDTDLDWD